MIPNIADFRCVSTNQKQPHQIWEHRCLRCKNFDFQRYLKYVFKWFQNEGPFRYDVLFMSSSTCE